MLTLFSPRLSTATQVTLDDAAAAHARVRRVREGDPVRLADGMGTIADGRVVRLTKHELEVAIDARREVPRPRQLTVVVPVADRDRMLWAAEKCVELQVTSWIPVMFARSRSVSPRGEGEKFREKVRLRMQSALEQSGAAWMPEIAAEGELSQVLDRLQGIATRVVLDSSGDRKLSAVDGDDAAILCGPEGGFEPAELESAISRGWQPISLGETILRFETAIVAAVSVIRFTGAN